MNKNLRIGHLYRVRRRFTGSTMCEPGIVASTGTMLHCECGWAWEWDDDPTPYCPYCGKLGGAGPGAPQEAKEAVEEADRV